MLYQAEGKVRSWGSLWNHHMLKSSVKNSDTRLLMLRRRTHYEVLLWQQQNTPPPSSSKVSTKCVRINLPSSRLLIRSLWLMQGKNPLTNADCKWIPPFASRQKKKGKIATLSSSSQSCSLVRNSSYFCTRETLAYGCPDPADRSVVVFLSLLSRLLKEWALK